jgi:hypothetical protein
VQQLNQLLCGEETQSSLKNAYFFATGNYIQKELMDQASIAPTHSGHQTTQARTNTGLQKDQAKCSHNNKIYKGSCPNKLNRFDGQGQNFQV